jgi:serine/threonine-protein kinase
VRLADDDDLVGQVIDGRFEILAPLGQGGMGTVYRAKQRSMGREIALKLIDRRFERDTAAVKRFMREAKLASQLAHPSTVSVIEFGQAPDGRLYFAMELVRGHTLHDELMTNGPLPPARLARIGTQVVDALEAAHAMGIVHRDLKLENVMLLDAPGDLIKIVDFGLARSFIDPTTRMSVTGQVSGTPRYMAPEVFEGTEPSPAQDLYAVGVMLAELATGKSPFDGATIEVLFTNKIATRPRLDGLVRGLHRIVERLLAARPGDRPTHAQVREALVGLTGTPLPAPATPLALASTTEVDGGPPVVELEPLPNALAAAPSDSAFTPPDSAFTPPDAGAQAKLELEKEWGQEKATKKATAVVHGSARASRNTKSMGWIGLVIALVVAGVVTAGVITQLHSNKHHDDYGKLPETPGTIGIEVRSRDPAMITIDGHKAGSAPLTLHVPKGTTPIEISNGKTLQSVIPDHDQMVDFSR